VRKPEILSALEPVVEAFNDLGVSYCLVGSIASSAYGMARSTMDVDLICNLGAEGVDAFVDILKPNYYADRDMILGAVCERSSFNLIHLESMIKIDGFVVAGTEYDKEVFQRRRKTPLEETEGAVAFFMASPEDVVLQKLQWFRRGGGISERQWNDILGVIRVQADALDKEYLTRWAAHMGNSALLRKAFADAGETV
jgi:hypothetical protein